MPLTPRQYQLTGADFLRTHRRAILADDAGLGKTLTAALATDANASAKPVLVATPTYLVWQWADFLADQFPNDTIAVASGQSPTAKTDAINSNSDWLIYNIEMLRRHPIPPRTQTLIIDEFHRLRGRNAQQSKAVVAHERDRRHQIPNIYGLTATPIYRDVGDLFMQLRILDPKRFTSYWQFIDRYAKTVETGYATRIVGTKNDLELIELMSHYLLRRTYDEVGLFLPSVIPSDVMVELSSAARTGYQTLKDSYRNPQTNDPINPGAALHELRRLTLPSKLDAILGLISDSRPATPVVIFTFYRESEPKSVLRSAAAPL